MGLMLIKKRPNRRFREDIPAGLPGFRSWCAGAPRADDDIDGIAVEQPENDAATARSKPGQEVADDRLEFIEYAQNTGHEDGSGTASRDDRRFQDLALSERNARHHFSGHLNEFRQQIDADNRCFGPYFAQEIGEFPGCTADIKNRRTIGRGTHFILNTPNDEFECFFRLFISLLGKVEFVVASFGLHLFHLAARRLRTADAGLMPKSVVPCGLMLSSRTVSACQPKPCKSGKYACPV